ncbi:MAG: cytochrome P450, partial [Pseudomonadales bacterium]|nr:cytochrome P450 [Pseudomonadales bacterium]
PGNKMWKALRGKAFLIDFFGEIAKQKRTNPGTDMFSRMCEAKDEDGNTLSNEAIVDHMLFMLVAAHDTNTATATNMLYAIAKNPEWQEKMRKEVLAIDKETMTYDDLSRMPSTELVFKETLRLYTPLPVIPRRSINECTVRGVTVPANTMIWIIPDFCHFMEEYWRTPETFDPMRFAPPREEHKKHAFAWHPFGGGAHMCMGMHFADMQIKLIMHTLLRKYRFSLPENHNDKYQFFPIPKPKDDLPIRIECI